MAKQTKDRRGAGAAAYLKRPYTRALIPEFDETYTAQILEFPGCIATGDSPAEAYENLERIAEGWIESALAQRQSIPEPMEEIEHSGKLVLRLPKSLHKKAALAAEKDGVSLNQFIVMAIGIQVGTVSMRPQVIHPMTVFALEQQVPAIAYIGSGATWQPVANESQRSWDQDFASMPVNQPLVRTGVKNA